MGVKRKIAVTGGCGYIGSHAMVDLILHGWDVFSIDSLVNSNEEVLEGIRSITGVPVRNYRIDLAASGAWHQLIEAEPDVVGVIHFAALKAVGDSVKFPMAYYDNNVNALLNTLRWMECAGIGSIIFSSSCTVYGASSELPVTEQNPFGIASSPYGRTKQIGEWILQDLATTGRCRAISLRYFNPAGAHPSAQIGESPRTPAQNLVPVITETAMGKRAGMTVYGKDYPTRDGTCIRDYVYIMDLARAHTLALERLLESSETPAFDAFNLGIGEGLTVLEMIHAFEKVSGQPLRYQIGARREGDMAAVYADSTKARQMLGWSPEGDVEKIMQTAWEWEKRRSNSG
ncbi:MAG: UDP-glucose 4-epimerase GalE [Saprospiraceae bacterium]|nr:UDP-glucose 4-epimerase GalE [Saprospiraceae bacterium]